MLDTLRRDWKRLKAATPGRRFRVLHAARARRPGKSRASRTILLASGGLLVFASPVVGLIPGPGGLAVLGAGAALLACELHFVARALDWCEPRLRRAWRRARSFAKRRRNSRSSA